MDIKEAVGLVLAFDEKVSLVEEAIAGTTTLSELATERGTTYSFALEGSRRSLPAIEAGNAVAHHLAARNPLIEPARKFDLKAIGAILDQDEYKTALAEPDGLAIVLCLLVRDLDTLADRACKKDIATLREISKNIISELAEPLVERRRAAKVGGNKSAQKRQPDSVESKVIKALADLAASGRPQRERAAIVAKRLGITSTRVRQIAKKTKIN